MIASIIAIALVQGSTAVAQQPAAPGQPPITVTGQKLRPEDQVVCKTSSTGSLIPTRICMTRGDWAKKQTDAREELDRLREFQRVR